MCGWARSATTAGTATNTGLIEATTGSASMTGRHVNQLGAIESTTSVSLNGRIDLLASYGAVGNPSFDKRGGREARSFFSKTPASSRSGRDSVTRILPEYASRRDGAGHDAAGEVADQHAKGRAIHSAAGALMLAPNADVTVRAGVWPYRTPTGNRTIFGADGRARGRT